MRAFFDRIAALPPWARLALTIVVGVTAWSVSSIGYFEMYPLLDAQIGYNDAPFFYVAYYGACSLVVLLAFHRSFAEFAHHRFHYEYLAPSGAMIAAFALVALFVLPRIPEAEWVLDGEPAEFFWATQVYFLPKSFEILFQQVIVSALVIALCRMQLSLRQVSWLVAVMFGGFHLSLIFTVDTLAYVAHYTVASTLFGAVLPYILLRWRGGFLINYAIHWSFYVYDYALIHFAMAAQSP